MPTPLALSDEEMAVVFRMAAPVAPHERDSYLLAVGAELGKHPAVGIGLVSRIAGEAQGHFTVEARSDATHGLGVVRRFARKRRDVAAEAEAEAEAEA